MTALLLSNDEWAKQLRSFDRCALRLEMQPQYDEPGELEQARQFATGEATLPTDDPGWRRWCAHIRDAVAAGKRVERVRVFEDPPTDYQRWLRWVSQLNVEAGEVQRYMTRERAHEVGLLPAAGDEDWWLLDDERLIVMRFDAHGRRVANELIVDPARIALAREWWDLAVRHSAPAASRSPST